MMLHQKAHARTQSEEIQENRIDLRWEGPIVTLRGQVSNPVQHGVNTSNVLHVFEYRVKYVREFVVFVDILRTRTAFQNLYAMVVQPNNFHEGILLRPALRKRVQLRCTLGKADAKLPAEELALLNSLFIVVTGRGQVSQLCWSCAVGAPTGYVCIGRLLSYNQALKFVRFRTGQPRAQSTTGNSTLRTVASNKIIRMSPRNAMIAQQA
jgi:hypothetical protein